MTHYNFDEFIDRRGTNCIKYDGCEPIYGTNNLLPMWIADMDFKTPDFVIDALRQRLDHPILGYFEHSDEFYASIVSWMNRRHQWKIQKEWILFSPGIVTGLAAIVQAFTNLGDKILVQSPVYHPFFYVIENQQRVLVKNPLKLINGVFEIDYDDLELKLQSGVKMMIISNPHNPIGRCWTKSELRRLAELSLKYRCLLVSDEIHSDLIMPGYKHTPTASISEDISSNTITCMSPSKTFNLAGLSTSEIIISNSALRERFMHFMVEEMHIHLGNTFGDVALVTAYTRGEEWLQQLLEYLYSNLQYLRKIIKDEYPKIELFSHEATYLVWMDFNRYGYNHEILTKRLVEKCGLALNDGIIFGQEGEGCMRMNIACPRATLVRAIEKLKFLE